MGEKGTFLLWVDIRIIHQSSGILRLRYRSAYNLLMKSAFLVLSIAISAEKPRFFMCIFMYISDI